MRIYLIFPILCISLFLVSLFFDRLASAQITSVETPYTITVTATVLSTSTDSESISNEASGGGGFAGNSLTNISTAALLTGFGVPFSTITLLDDGAISTSTIVSDSGTWSLLLGNISPGQHQFFIRATDRAGVTLSSYSVSINIAEGSLTKVENIELPLIRNSASFFDINKDEKINLVDFSILAFWFQRDSPPSNVDMNRDGIVNLADFSILAYYWTG